MSFVGFNGVAGVVVARVIIARVVIAGFVVAGATMDLLHNRINLLYRLHQQL
jgi:type III secretory pathway component EscU